MYTSKYKNDKGNAIATLYKEGKTLRAIENILWIKFTWKNAATGEVIQLQDLGRCILADLMEYDLREGV